MTLTLEEINEMAAQAEKHDADEPCRDFERAPALMISDLRSQVDRQAVRKQVAEVGGKIKQTRRESVPHHEKNANVCDVVAAAMRKRGEFFNDGVRAYLFLRDTRILLPLDFGQLGLELLPKDYGLFPGETITKQVIDGLRLEAHAEGRRIEIHAFTYYDPANHAAYVYDFDGGIYRLGSDKIDRLNNGTDGVLFIQNPQWAPLI